MTSSATDLTETGDGLLAQAGRLFGAGDVNGDGYDDLVVAAAGAGSVRDASDHWGRVRVYLGQTNGAGLATPAAVTLNGTDGTNGFFGDSLSVVGDINGDHLADLVAGSSNVVSRAGRAYVHLGNATAVSVTGVPIESPDGRGSLFATAIAQVFFPARRGLPRIL